MHILPMNYSMHMVFYVGTTAGVQDAAVFSVSSAADHWPEGGAAQENADRHILHILYHCSATERRSTCM